jgi:hypothetical protein
MPKKLSSERCEALGVCGIRSRCPESYFYQRRLREIEAIEKHLQSQPIPNTHYALLTMMPRAPRRSLCQ